MFNDRRASSSTRTTCGLDASFALHRSVEGVSEARDLADAICGSLVLQRFLVEFAVLTPWGAPTGGRAECHEPPMQVPFTFAPDPLTGPYDVAAL